MENTATVTASHELIPDDSHASFYGKAIVMGLSDGTLVLRSYETNVCAVSPDGTFHRFWWGHSVTTMRHINAFLRYACQDGGGKAWWERLPVEDCPISIRNARPARRRKYRADYWCGYNADRICW